MAIQVTMTTVSPSEDERPEAKVEVHLLEFDTSEEYEHWLSLCQSASSSCSKMTEQN